MKYHILNYFRTSIPLKEKSLNHFKDLKGLKLLTNLDANLTSSSEGVMNNMLTVQFLTPLGDEVRLKSKLVSSFSF